jgi:3-methyladenine DNA glycosylase AlkD
MSENVRATYQEAEKALLSLRNPERAILCARYFKTGKGEYAEGDVFLGLTVPEVRTLVKKYYRTISLPDVGRLLRHQYHEARLLALLVLVAKYEHTDDRKEQKAIFTLYTKHTRHINNWDLVDTSAPQIVGAYLSNNMEHEERLAFIEGYCHSRDLWKNRIIVLSTFYQIRKGNEKMTYFVARTLLRHPHDLIHKALGWMLREVGKRDRKVLSAFLDEYAQVMPRTMLRYALEHYPKREREMYMKMKRIGTGSSQIK